MFTASRGSQGTSESRSLESVRPKSVAYVPGTCVYPCLRKEVATPVGIEPTTSSLEGWRSIQLSYGVTNSF